MKKIQSVSILRKVGICARHATSLDLNPTLLWGQIPGLSVTAVRMLVRTCAILTYMWEHTPGLPVKAMRRLWRQQAAIHTSGGLLVIHIRIVILIYIYFLTLLLRGGLGPVRNKWIHLNNERRHINSETWSADGLLRWHVALYGLCDSYMINQLSQMWRSPISSSLLFFQWNWRASKTFTNERLAVAGPSFWLEK